MPVGIRRLPKSWQAYVDVYGKRYYRTFSLDTTPSTMKLWREQKRAEVKFGQGTATGRTFKQEATDDYLPSIASMPSYATRAHHIQCWVDVFGDRPRSSITATDIRKVLEQWKRDGNWKGGPLSNGSLNRRRASLMAMYLALDGRSKPCVVRDVRQYDERGSIQMRAQPMLTMAKIIRRAPRRTASRHRLHVLLWTGWPAKILMGITPADLFADAVRVPDRLKGRGFRGGIVPVHRRAMWSLRWLAARGKLGRFSTTGLFYFWQRCVTRENATRATPLPHLRTYDLRHSFLTWAATRIKDDRAMMLIARSKQIARYTLGSETERLRDAMHVLHVSRRIPADSQGFSTPRNLIEDRQKQRK